MVVYVRILQSNKIYRMNLSIYIYGTYYNDKQAVIQQIQQGLAVNGMSKKTADAQAMKLHVSFSLQHVLKY